jgi:hypothetical protein
MIKSLGSREASGELAAAAKGNALPNLARQRLAASTDEQPAYLTLEIGSDVEISRRLWNRLNEMYGRVSILKGTSGTMAARTGSLSPRMNSDDLFKNSMGRDIQPVGIAGMGQTR